jgi:molybdate transport system substrate-binding protein
MIIVKWSCKDKKADIMNRGLKISMILFLVAMFVAASSVAFAESRKEITVSAAMSLKNGFQEIGKVFEAKHGGVKVRFNFGASGDLIRQIEGGAPVSVFASASPREMEELESRGLIISGSRFDFASNSLVVVVPSGSSHRPGSFAGLAADRVQRIAVGNFKTSPAGRYAEEAFQSYRILPSIKDKLIFAENVRQVLDYVARREVDAGIVYATDAKLRISDVEIAAVADERSHGRIIYSLAKIKNSSDEKLAWEFMDFTLSKEGRKILGKYGFKSISNK